MEPRSAPAQSPLAPLALAAAASQRFLPLRLPSLAPSLPSLPVAMAPAPLQRVAPQPPLVGLALGAPRSLSIRGEAPDTQEQAPSPSRPAASISFLLNPSGGEAGAQQLQEPPTSALAPPKKKRKTRVCKAEGCDKYVVDRGLCIRHGGGKRCSVEGCNCRAQNRGLCWKHGGYTQCTVEGCSKRAKSRGICWSHGGGTRCKHPSCAKIAVSHGLCWAHGGGKRCRVDGCQKPAYERNGNLCAEHCGGRAPAVAAVAAVAATTAAPAAAVLA